MFRCQVTGKLSAPNESSYKIVTKVKSKSYFYARNRDGEIFKVSEQELGDLERRGLTEKDINRSQGYDILEEKTVLKEVYEKHVAAGGYVS